MKTNIPGDNCQSYNPHVITHNDFQAMINDRLFCEFMTGDKYGTYKGVITIRLLAMYH